MSPTSSRRALLIILLLVAVAAGAVLWKSRHWMEINRGIYNSINHNHEEAVAILSHANLQPPNYRPLHYLVRSYLRLDQRDEAESMLQQTCEIYPKWAGASFELGLLLLRHGEWETGLQNIAWSAGLADDPEAYPLEPEDMELAEAVVSLESGKTRDALMRIQSLRQRAEDTADVCALIEAVTQFQLARWIDAREPLEMSLSINPNNPHSAVLMALVYATDGDWHRARLWFDNARSMNLDLANQTLLTNLRRQIDIGNTFSLRGGRNTALTRDGALAWLMQIWAEAGLWNHIVNYLEIIPSPDRILHHAVWFQWYRAFEEIGDEDAAEEMLNRTKELNPVWNLDPDWPIWEVYGRWGWTVRDGEWASDEWDEIALPLGDDRPENSAPFGEELNELNIFGPAAIDFTINVQVAGWYRLIFNMHGRNSGPIWPLIEISTPPLPPEVRYVNSREHRNCVVALYLEPGENTVRFEYVNDGDHLVEGEDRNVILAHLWREKEPLIRGDI